MEWEVFNKIDKIHLSIGGDPECIICSNSRPITAAYFVDGGLVGSFCVGEPLAMVLCDPWFDTDKLPENIKKAKLTADWFFDVGRATTLETRMERVLRQIDA